MGLNHSPRIVTDGLILCLDAANKKSYPGSGTTWTDLSGRNNHVTLYNSPTFSSSNGGYFVFDGINDYARTTSALNLSNTNAVTIFQMVKLNSYSSLSVLYEFSGNFNAVPGSFVATFSDTSVGQSNQVMASILGNVGYNISSYDKTLLNDLIWHSHTITHDMSQSTKENLIYHDGGSVISELFNPVSGYASNNTGNFANDFLFLGSRAGSAYFASMNLSYFSLYNRALSASEIQQNFNALKGRYGI